MCIFLNVATCQGFKETNTDQFMKVQFVYVNFLENRLWVIQISYGWFGNMGDIGSWIECRNLSKFYPYLKKKSRSFIKSNDV